MTVDNRGGLATGSTGVNPDKLQLLDDFLVRGACADLGGGAREDGPALAPRWHSGLQVDLTDRRDPAVHGAARFAALDAVDIGSLGRTFDNVVAFDLLEHIPDEARLLSALAGVCTGRLLLSVPNADDSQPAQ